MTYNPDICNAGDLVSTVITEINNNFSALDTIFDINHVAYSDETTNRSKHKFSTFVNLTSKGIDSPTLTTKEMAMYVKNVSGVPRLFYREPTTTDDDNVQTAGVERQFSGSVITGAASATSGEAPIPGGLSLKWGTFSVPSTASFPKTFVGDFGLTDYPTACFLVIGSSLDINVDVDVMSFSSFDKTGFTFKGEPFPGGKMQWMAIGL